MANAGARKTWRQTILAMDTTVSLTVVTSQPEAEAATTMKKALNAFGAVEAVCSRFSSESEVTRLCARVGSPVSVSDLLFEALRFARAMAEATDGAFDPTVGRRLESYGFNRHYLSRETRTSAVDPSVAVSYRDVILDETQRTVLLRKSLVLDLGAVAKGMAVDLAARELAGAGGFVIDAGGDVFAAGLNDRDEPWTVGIAHPEHPDEPIYTLRLSNAAVCTSGSYERPSPLRAGSHHLIDPHSGASRSDLLSCSVVAPFAMLADAMSTAAFVMGRERGMAFLNEAGLGGLFIDPTLTLYLTDSLMGDQT